jgi:hypothetical protein
MSDTYAISEFRQSGIFLQAGIDVVAKQGGFAPTGEQLTAPLVAWQLGQARDLSYEEGILKRKAC